MRIRGQLISAVAASQVGKKKAKSSAFMNFGQKDKDPQKAGSRGGVDKESSDSKAADSKREGTRKAVRPDSASAERGPTNVQRKSMSELV